MTTQVPKQILLDNELNKGDQKIALTQNRRLANQLVATLIAEDWDVQLGSVVGLKHRGRNQTSKLTKQREVFAISSDEDQREYSRPRTSRSKMKMTMAMPKKYRTPSIV